MTRNEYKEWNRKAMTGEVSDDLNPAFIFACTNTALIEKIASGEIDAKELAKRVLEGRR